MGADRKHHMALSGIHKALSRRLNTVAVLALRIGTGRSHISRTVPVPMARRPIPDR